MSNFQTLSYYRLELPEFAHSAIAGLTQSQRDVGGTGMEITYQYDGLKLRVHSNWTRESYAREAAQATLAHCWTKAGLEGEVPTLRFYGEDGAYAEPRDGYVESMRWAIPTPGGSEGRDRFANVTVGGGVEAWPHFNPGAYQVPGRDVVVFVTVNADFDTLDAFEKLIYMYGDRFSGVYFDPNWPQRLAGAVVEGITYLFERQTRWLVLGRLPHMTLVPVAEAKGMMATLAREATLSNARQWGSSIHEALRKQLSDKASESRRIANGYRDQMRVAHRQMDAAMRELAGLQPYQVNEGEIEWLKAMLDNRRLLSFTPTPGQAAFTFTTPTIYAQDERTGGWHAMGEFDVRVDLVNFGLNIISSTPQDAYRSSMNHPHVFSDGHVCKGDFEDMFVDLCQANDWTSLIEMVLAFLETADTSDEAGRYIHKWPLVQIPEEIGKAPYPEGFVPYGNADREPFEDGEGFLFEWDDEAGQHLYAFEWDTDYDNIVTGHAYDSRGFNIYGENQRGFDRNGNHGGTGTRYDESGYDFEGYNEDGYDESGYDFEGYNEDGYDESGYDRDGRSPAEVEGEEEEVEA